MDNTKDEILKVDGVSDIVMEVAKLRTERDYYKEKYESLLHFTIKNTRLGFRANLTKEKAEKDAKAREEAKDE